VLLNSGNLEIQKQNTGGAGNKVMKIFCPPLSGRLPGALNIWV
ncbi:hypothetical protein GFJ88_15535, partial [Salmonella enterica subsp. enterica serovar Enteritidis]|nr:hypothetical protein [Salmonella enterica subsp. enterica serovar Enteritidis]